MFLTLENASNLLNDFEKELKNSFSICVHIIDNNTKVFIIEDSLVLLGCIIEFYNPYPIEKQGNYYYLSIEELTYNNLSFKFNCSDFCTKCKNIYNIDLPFYVEYLKFKGYNDIRYMPGNPRYYSISAPRRVDLLLPNLKLKERIDAWPGFLYYIIVLELESADNKIGVGIFYTNQKPHNYINRKCNKWIKNGFSEGNMNLIGQGHYGVRKYKNKKYAYHLEEAFYSYKDSQYSRLKRQIIIEKHLTYFYIKQFFKNKSDIEKYAYELLAKTCQGKCEDIEKCVYSKPKNKWINEELVYNLVKKGFKGYKIIYQHRPFFLRTPKGGQMSYDVFIVDLNIAIEYQGKQHFEPVEFFGGKEGFEQTIKRDRIKQEISKQNNVKLIYINYWEEITEKLIRDKVNNCLN